MNGDAGSNAPTAAFIGLGANLGDKRAALQGAVASLDAAPDVRVRALSSLYETAPVGGPEGQDTYLNAAAALETTLSPLALLDLLQAIEAAHHRTRAVRWGPRTLDLDILFFDQAVMASDRLILPHPRLHERRFVLAPLSEIAPDYRHPSLGLAVSALLDALDPSDAGEVRRKDGPNEWRSA